MKAWVNEHLCSLLGAFVTKVSAYFAAEIKVEPYTSSKRKYVIKNKTIPHGFETLQKQSPTKSPHHN